MDIGLQTRTARKFRGMSQAELATAAEIPGGQPRISMIETGARHVYQIEHLVRIADALEVSVDYLLGRDGNLSA